MLVSLKELADVGADIITVTGAGPFATMRKVKKYINAKLWQISSYLEDSST